MFLRKLGKRGAEMVEYAIVLACIAAVGVGFYSSNDSKLTGVLDNLFGNVAQVLGLAPSQNTPSISSSFFLDNTKKDISAYESAIKGAVDKIYSTFNIDGKPLASINWNDDGTITQVSYYNSDANNNFTQVSNANTILDTYGTNNINTLFSGSSDDPKYGGFLAFNKDAQVIKKLDSQTTGNTYSHLAFQSKYTEGKFIQIECAKDASQVNTFSYCSADDINKNGNYNGDKSIYE